VAFCPNCGAEHPQDASFCPSCGRPLTARAARAARGYGGFWRRLAAFVIDFLVINIPLGLIARAASSDSGFRAHHRGQHGVFLVYHGVWALIAIAVHWLYFALQESSARQATLGKMALGVRVTDGQGNRISFGRATGRHFAKLLSALIIFIGFIMAGFTDRKRALHDMIADTLVEKT
jgi:uncharacterized RDD family membrane protein YckC